MTTPTDPRVDAYLRQLDYALASLPWDQRNELFTDISTHIQHELLTAGGDPAVVDGVLERLGDPHAIAREAGAGPVPAPAPTPSRSRALEITAVVLIAIGGFVLPFIGWVIGVALLWSSRRFTTRDKWIGSLLPPLGFFAPFFLAFVAPTSGTQVCSVGFPQPGGMTQSHCTGTASSAVTQTVGLLVFVLLLTAAAYTVVRLSRRVARMN